MAKIIVTEFISLDGVIDSPGGESGYKHTGWSFELSRGDAGDKFKLDEALGADGLLLGRVTYDGFAAAWPEREGEFADKFNNMPKYVVSKTLGNPEWTNTTVLDGNDAVAALTEFRDEVDGVFVVHGSATLTQTLIENDLVDELRLMVYPLVLGSGKRLWGETPDKHRYSLKTLEPVGEDGVSVQVFERFSE